MGHPDFRVRAKVFATLNADESVAAVRCDPASLELQVGRDPAAFRDAWGGRWMGIDLSRVEDSKAKELLEDAWRSIDRKSVV